MRRRGALVLIPLIRRPDCCALPDNRVTGGNAAAAAPRRTSNRIRHQDHTQSEHSEEHQPFSPFVEEFGNAREQAIDSYPERLARQHNQNEREQIDEIVEEQAFRDGRNGGIGT